MTTSGPKIQDFTDKERPLGVEVHSDPVYETLMSLFVFHGEKSDADAYEIGDVVVDAVKANADERLIEEIRSIGGCGQLSLSLVGIAQQIEGERTVETLVAHLRAIGPAQLRLGLLRSSGIKQTRGYDSALIDRAVKGDMDAVTELLGSSAESGAVGSLLERDPDQMLEDVVSILERFHAATRDVVAAQQDARERDAANTRAMAKTMSPDRLVEKVTNGITFEMQPHLSGVLLVPSVVIRPWVVIAEHETLRIFAYGISDEALTADEDAPPAFLVDTFKALGDEKRLRLLGVLAEGDIGLKELAQRADIAKSTAHHHLRVLRSAGLVRVIVGDDDKRYGLRRDSIPEAGRLLESFLASRPADTSTEKDSS